MYTQGSQLLISLTACTAYRLCTVQTNVSAVFISSIADINQGTHTHSDHAFLCRCSSCCPACSLAFRRSLCHLPPGQRFTGKHDLCNADMDPDCTWWRERILMKTHRHNVHTVYILNNMAIMNTQQSMRKKYTTTHTPRYTRLYKKSGITVQ